MPENRRADPHMGRAERDCTQIVRTHAHAPDHKLVAIGNFGEQGKMQSGLFIHRRDAHQPLDIEVQIIAAFLDESIDLAGWNARLLRLFPCVDLNIAG